LALKIVKLIIIRCFTLSTTLLIEPRLETLWPAKDIRLKFVSHAGTYEQELDGSIIWAEEVDVVGTVVRQLLSASVKLEDIVVIFGYLGHANKIQENVPGIVVKTFDDIKVCYINSIYRIDYLSKFCYFWHIVMTRELCGIGF